MKSITHSIQQVPNIFNFNKSQYLIDNPIDYHNTIVKNLSITLTFLSQNIL